MVLALNFKLTEIKPIIIISQSKSKKSKEQVAYITATWCKKNL